MSLITVPLLALPLAVVDKRDSMKISISKLASAHVPSYSVFVFTIIILSASLGVRAESIGETKGFVLSHFWYAMPFEPDDCPNGLAVALPGGINPPKLYSAGREGDVPPHLRSRQRTVGEVDQCRFPEAFEDPIMRTGKGRVAYGLNLDGSIDPNIVAPNTCKHENYTGIDGTLGVDNQLYRVLGCINAYRSDSKFQQHVIRDFIASARQDGQVTTLMEVTGIDDAMNDTDVEVGFYSSTNPTLYDSQRKGVPYSSLTVSDNPRWQNKLRGKIVDGLIITEPGEIRLDHYQGQGLPKHVDMYMRAAQLRLQIHEDGTATGELAGYSDVESVYNMEFAQAPPVLPKSWGYKCPAVYEAIHRLADGYPDPETGKCTAISTAYHIEAVPAFLIHQNNKDGGTETAFSK